MSRRENVPGARLASTRLALTYAAGWCLVLSGCQADLKQGWFACSDGKCPPGQFCQSDGLCHSTREGSLLAADGGETNGADAALRGTIDASMPPARVGSSDAGAVADASGPAGGAGQAPSAGKAAGAAAVGGAAGQAGSMESTAGVASSSAGASGEAHGAAGMPVAGMPVAGMPAAGSGGAAGCSPSNPAACLTCMSDTDCDPNAGVCKVRHCNLASHSCEPQNAADRVACNNGADVCKAGQCVQCLAVADCDGDPGVCKQFECSADNACKTKNAADHADCRNAGRTGVCAGGTCVGCSDNNDCKRLSPSTPICANGACAECASAGECATSTCHRASCNAGFCAQEVTAWVSCATGRVCNASGTCAQSCGNGHLDAGEECEIGVAGWDFLSCDSGSCQRLTYRPCTSSRDCDVGCASGGLCGETCSTTADCPRAPPNSTATCYEGDCALACDNAAQCPTGLTCVNDPLRHEGHTGICLADPACKCEPAPDGCSSCIVPLISD